MSNVRNAVAVREEHLSTVATPMGQKLAYAQQLAAANLLPANYRGKPGNVLLAVEYGEMLGTHPLTAIQQVHVIDGKLSMSAELMRALTKRAGHRFRVLESTAECAKVSISRADDPEFSAEFAFTIEDATRAKVNEKDVWKKYPAAMLLARATSMAVRAVCPEVLMGISYVPEELGARVDAEGDYIDAEVIDLPVVDEHARWAADLSDRFDALPDTDRAGIQAHIVERYNAEGDFPPFEDMDDKWLAWLDTSIGACEARHAAEAVPEAHDPEPEPEAKDYRPEVIDDADKPSTAQMRKLHAAMRERGIMGPARHAFATDVLNLAMPVTSLNDLDRHQIRLLIDHLEAATAESFGPDEPF